MSEVKWRKRQKKTYFVVVVQNFIADTNKEMKRSGGMQQGRRKLKDFQLTEDLLLQTVLLRELN